MHLQMLSTLELEVDYVQHEAGAGGGGGLAGIAQWERVRVPDRAVAGSNPGEDKRERSCAFPGGWVRVPRELGWLGEGSERVRVAG